MGLNEKAKNILAIIYLNYWCDTQQKINYTKLLEENELKHQKEIREKYNPDTIFKNNNNIKHEDDARESEIYNDVSIIEYKESFFKKLINCIKSFFHIN